MKMEKLEKDLREVFIILDNFEVLEQREQKKSHLRKEHVWKKRMRYRMKKKTSRKSFNEETIEKKSIKLLYD